MSAEVVSSRFPVGPPAQPSLTCVLRPGADLENQPCLSRQHPVTITSYGREDWVFLGDADYAAQMVPRPKYWIDSTRFGWLKPILLGGGAISAWRCSIRTTWHTVLVDLGLKLPHLM